MVVVVPVTRSVRVWVGVFALQPGIQCTVIVGTRYVLVVGYCRRLATFICRVNWTEH